MEDEDKTGHQVVNELEALETERKRTEQAIPGRRMLLPVVSMFVMLCILACLNEILDLPYLLLGAPHTPINWREAIVEMVLIASVGFFMVLRLIRDITERKWAEEALHQRADDLSALYEASQTFLRHLDTETIIESICRLAVDSFGLKMAWVGLVVEGSFEVRPASACGFEEGYLDSVRVTWDDSPTGRGPTGMAIRTGQPMVMNHIESDPAYAPWREAAKARGYRSSAALPLCHGEQVLGALNVYSAEPAYFTDEWVQVLQSFANQAAIAIENARLLEAEQRSRQIAETLRAANLALTQTLDLDAVLETLLDYLGRLVPYDGANVMLLEADSRLALRAVRGYERWTDLEQTRTIILDAQANPIIHALLTTQESVLIPDTNEHPGWESLLAGAEHMRNWLGVPLVAGGEVIGLYSMDKAKLGFFTEEHLRLAEALAAQAAVAIQNARLFEQVRAGRERLQTLSRQLVEVQEAERHHIARELHDEVGQALTGLKLLLDMSTRLPADEVTASLGEAQALVNELMALVRDLSLDLRPSMLDDLGLLPVLLWHFDRYTAQTRVRVAFKHSGLEGRRFAPQVETAAYRIVQEALTNVARHAGVSEVAVRLWTDQDTLAVQIEDQGAGFAPEAALAASVTTGLAGMRERALLLGGQLTVESAPGSGTRVTAEFPLGDSVEKRERGRRA